MFLLTTLGIVGTAHSGVTVEKLAAGERSGIAAARTVVVRNEADWQQLWSEHGSRQPIPKVDFAARMVVGVFLGTRPTSGFSVQIVEVRQEHDSVVVKYTERSPSPGSMVMQVLTLPFCLASVPTSGDDVRFERAASVPRSIR